LKRSDDANLHAIDGRKPMARSLWANLPVPIAIVVFAVIGRFVVTPKSIGAYNFEILMQVGVAIVLAVSLQLINGFGGQFSLGHAGFMAVGAYLSGYPSIAYGQQMTNPAGVLFYYVALFVTVGIAGAVVYAVFYLVRLLGKFHPSLPMVVLLLIFAWVVFDVSRASKYEVPPAYLVVTRGVALLKALFTMIADGGAPLAAKLSGIIPLAVRGPICFVILLAGGGSCAAGAGLVVGLPTLRLRGDYLAIATLGFAEIIRIGIQNAKPLGGPLGLGGIPNYTDFGWLFGVGCVVTIVAIWRIAYSDKGRAIQAVREDEIAAAATGVDPTHYKVLSFIVGSFFAGVGGALYSHYSGFITPQEFGLVRSIEFVVMVTLGGLASISGAILAAIVLTLLPEVLRNINRDLAEYRMAIYSLLLIVMMLLRPQGLLGGRELWPGKWRKARRALPPPTGFPVISPAGERPAPAEGQTP
jgi:ABC-type branched-subunit amino acid transport system permease subunit